MRYTVILSYNTLRKCNKQQHELYDLADLVEAAPPLAAGSTPRDGLKDEPRQKDICQSTTKNPSMNILIVKGICHEINNFLKTYNNKYFRYFLYMHC
jgi:hypothetical protein